MIKPNVPKLGFRVDFLTPHPQTSALFKGKAIQIGAQKLLDPQAHSFPPISLDRRSTELIVSPKKVVGCRGGSRYVKGCWDFL